MWSCRRILVRAGVAAALLSLGACGFRPIYGSYEGDLAPAAQLNRVEIASIPDRSGQTLRNLLIDRFYGAQAPAKEDYRLNTQLRAVERKTGVRQDATATRAQLTLTAPFQLIDVTTNKVLYRSQSSVRVSYNLLDAQYATLASKDYAYERGLIFLADDIRTRVAMFFARDPLADAEPLVSELPE